MTPADDLEEVLTAVLACPVGDIEREAARLRLGDTACAIELGTSLSEWTGAAAAFARLGDGATLGLGVASELAACGRLTEVDDIHLRSCTTPGSVAVPAAVAAVLAGAAPQAALEGIVVGYAVAAAAGELVGGALLPPGALWTTRAVAPLASAAAAARSLGLSAEESLDACALAAGTEVAGTMPEPGRAFSLGMAVRSGMAAVAAAAEGIPADRGRLQAWTRRIAGDTAGARPGTSGHLAAAARRSAAVAAVLESRIKPYAGARQVLAASAGLRALVEAGEVTPGEVRRIRLAVPPIHAPMIDRPQLRRRLDTLASAQYQLSLALEDPGRLDELEHELPPLPAVAERMGTVAVAGAGELEAGFPARWGAGVVLETSGGERSLQLHGVPGEDEVTWDALGRKAARLAAANGSAPDLAAGLLGRARAGEVAWVAEELVAALATARKGGT